MNSTAALTKRESQIAEFLAWGGTKKEIACRLFISPRTVEATTRSIYEKAGVTKVNELSAWYFCTHFHISFALSPLSRILVSSALLILIVVYEMHPGNELLRASRGKRVECKCSRSKKNDSNDYNPFEI
jgi:DNA-binding CsgD family transcriptional regulator